VLMVPVAAATTRWPNLLRPNSPMVQQP